MKSIKEFRLGFIYGCYGDGMGWFRLFNKYGVAFKDLKRHDLIFSERNGYAKTYRIFNWSFKILKP